MSDSPVEPPKLRPLRAGAGVMFCIAGADGAIKVIEYFAGTSLWKMMLVTGVFVFLLDVLIYDRSQIGDWVRSFLTAILQATREGFSWLWRNSVRGWERLNRPR